MSIPSEYRIYVIVPRNLDVPDHDGKMKKITVTCGRQGGYVGHAAAMLQLELIKEELSITGEITAKNFASVGDIAQQDILSLMVAGSVELIAERDRLIRQGLRVFDYVDADKQFSGDQVTAVVIEPLKGTQRDLVRHLKPWRCACNNGPESRSAS